MDRYYVIETWCDEEKSLMQSFMYPKGNDKSREFNMSRLNPHCTKLLTIIEVLNNNYKQVYPKVDVSR